MKLIFEKGNIGRSANVFPECDVPIRRVQVPLREITLQLPEVSENEISRHYTQIAKQAYGINDGFYPLGSCTMKYNPPINDAIAGLPQFMDIHPLQPISTVQGCLKVMDMTEKYLCEITGMDGMSLQPAAGAQGEFTGLLLIKAYHEKRGDTKRRKIIIPDSAHGTNPASAAMAGFITINIPSKEDGCVDLEALKNAIGDDTAGLMLTNPNTVGLFDQQILEITKIIHEAGGLNYYDGANLNAIMGIARPGDMGFDVIHLNLHKTFSTPHGGGGPGSGPCGCKEFLKDYLPGQRIGGNETYYFEKAKSSIGEMGTFHGNFLVVVRALVYIITLGREGIVEVAQNAVLNANYMMEKLKDIYPVAYPVTCMHEFVVSMEKMKKSKNISAMDIAKALLDYKMHPPTMYFPLSVPEALMIEPTETQSREMLEEAIGIYREVYERANQNPEEIQKCPKTTPVHRLDEVMAARKPVLTYDY